MKMVLVFNVVLMLLMDLDDSAQCDTGETDGETVVVSKAPEVSHHAPSVSPTKQPKETCKDKSPFCKHMAVPETCLNMESVRLACKKSCGLCQVDCKRVEIEKRKNCGPREEIGCNDKNCCWEKVGDPNVTPWCYLDVTPAHFSLGQLNDKEKSSKETQKTDRTVVQ